MTVIDFPDTPTVGQVFDKWTWNGTMWALTAEPKCGLTASWSGNANNANIPWIVATNIGGWTGTTTITVPQPGTYAFMAKVAYGSTPPGFAASAIIINGSATFGVVHTGYFTGMVTLTTPLTAGATFVYAVQPNATLAANTELSVWRVAP